MKQRDSLWFGLLTCLLTFATFTAHAALPIAEFLFDEPGGSYATNTGSSSLTARLELFNNGALSDTHGTGIARGGLDQRFVNPSSGQAQSSTGGGAGSIDDANLDSLVSFTVMAWIKSETTFVGNERRLFDKADGGAAGFMLDGGESGPSQDLLRLRVNGSTVLSGNAYSNVNQWTFFAVTYDGSIGANNVKFYKGDQGGGFSNATLVSTTTLAAGTVLDSTAPFVVAGRFGGNVPRSFDGIMDVARVFGSQTDGSGALSLSDIQFWQTQIPEPSTILLLSVGGVLLLRRRS